MARRGPNFIWCRRASRAWLETHEARLSAETGGTHAVVERPGRAHLALEFFCENKRQAARLVAEFGGTIAELPHDWFARFLAANRSKPLRLGGRLTVFGAEEDVGATSREMALIIPAGAAFGTGEHATTAMTLRLLERVSRRQPAGWRMLDAGTGSGVLALAGKCFGAGDVRAIDNDRAAIATARENARQNAIGRVQFAVADVTKETGGAFDIITANLYSDLLETVLPQFRGSLAADGRLILSGVLRAQEPGLTRGLRRNGFRVLEARRRGKWVALLADRLPSPPAHTRDRARNRSGAGRKT